MPSLFAPGEFVLDYPTIYGISLNERIWTVIYHLSKHPDLHIECCDDILNYEEKSEHLNYMITFLDDQTNCLLIKNSGSNAFFYPKYKNVEYLLCACDENEINPEIIDIISEFTDISLCFALHKPNQKEILNFIKLQ